MAKTPFDEDRRQWLPESLVTLEYRRLMPYATGDKQAEHSANAPQGASLLAISGEVNRLITTAINVNPRRVWHRPDALSRGDRAYEIDPVAGETP